MCPHHRFLQQVGRHPIPPISELWILQDLYTSHSLYHQQSHQPLTGLARPRTSTTHKGSGSSHIWRRPTNSMRHDRRRTSNFKGHLHGQSTCFWITNKCERAVIKCLNMAVPRVYCRGADPSCLGVILYKNSNCPCAMAMIEALLERYDKPSPYERGY